MDYEHIPVLYKEVLALLQPQPGKKYIDATLGAGGHSAGILAASKPSGLLLALDQDPEAIAYASQRLIEYRERVTFVNDNFANLGAVATQHSFSEVDGIVMDLGLSSRQLANSQRGFSFLRDGPLDMRYSPDQAVSATDLVNHLDASELAEIFWRYGEEKNSRRIALEIVARRPLRSTSDLVKAVEAVQPRKGRIHPATKVFQALRIAVNEELVSLEKGLASAVKLLRPGGRLAVISFHSLEDRQVKRLFRRLSQACICPPEQPICTCGGQAVTRLITKKAVQASEAEVAVNPRSRSARLRVIEKLSVDLAEA